MSAVSADALPAPLSREQVTRLSQLAEGLGSHQLYWVAAWAARRASGLPPAVAVAATMAAPRMTVLYGSQTGNSRRQAEGVVARFEDAGLPVRLLRADAYPHRELATETHVLLVISTQGEGEPPDDARGLFDFITGRRAPQLAGLQFAVLGLGDSSYPEFCSIGRRLDARLEELGGTRFAPFGACDVDVDEVAGPWADRALQSARELLGDPVPVVPAIRVAALHAVPPPRAYSCDHPFQASVLANQRIVARDHDRVVHHLELSLEGSGLRYAPGDAIGVWPDNPPELVRQWLDVLPFDGASAVTCDGHTHTMAEWLGCRRELTRLTRAFVAAQAEASGSPDLAEALRKEHADRFAALLGSHQPIDLLRRYPVDWTPEALLAALRPLTPRLYSIASSAQATGEGEVHLTVAEVAYEAFGQPHWGAASRFLATLPEDATLPVYIEPNERFRLPADDGRDIIMIGAGTGVAPFRGFLQERRETGARGCNWLVFGNRHFTQDFLYQTEWQQALKAGHLHRLDLAFSRDATTRVYVQDRLREQGRAIHTWLKEGAHLYVCGDARRMARDVHDALVGIAVEHGGHTDDSAREWLSDLLTQGRYARDVY